MLITDRFVMINFPKTGSSFAREVIRKAMRHPGSLAQRIAWKLGKPRPTCTELLMKQRFFNPAFVETRDEAHGAYCQIPAEHRHKVIMSVVREPASRLVSLYEFRGWTRKIRPSLEEIQAVFPHFPDLDFPEFYRLMMEVTHNASLPQGMRTELGPQTVQFIRFFARDPLATMLALRDDTDLRADWDKHFPAVRFLHTEDLNKELHAFLLEMGMSRASIAFVENKEKSNVTERTKATYLTDAMLDDLAWRERFLYQLFPEYLKALDTWRPSKRTHP